MKYREYGNYQAYLDEEIAPISNEVLSKLGLVATAEPGVIANNHLDMASFEYACQVNGGDIDVYVEPSSLCPMTLATESPKIRPVLSDKLSFGNIIQKSRAEVSLGEGDRRPVFDVEMISSPKGINNAQRLLGRDPGTDAFELVRMPGYGAFSSEEWLHGFANMQVPVAGLEHKIYAVHDTDPGDHVQSWLVTPPRICRKIAEQAAKLLEHGDRPNDDRPFDVMARCLDDLSQFTRPILSAVYDDAKTEHGLSISKLKLVRDHGVEHTKSMSIRFPGLLFLGIENDETTSVEALTAQTTAEYTEFIAQQLIDITEQKGIAA